MDIIVETYKLLKKIASKDIEQFTGIGLVVYDEKNFDRNCHCDLRPDISCPHYHITDDKICDYLIDISKHENTLHDGFHMVNEKGTLSYVAQYFVPPVIQSLKPHQDHGVRVYSSMCGSVLPGVLLIGVISSNYDIYIFRKGEYVDLAKLETKEKMTDDIK